MLLVINWNEKLLHCGMQGICNHILLLRVLVDWRWMCGKIDLFCRSSCFCTNCVKNKFQIDGLLHFSCNSYYCLFDFSVVIPAINSSGTSFFLYVVEEGVNFAINTKINFLLLPFTVIKSDFSWLTWLILKFMLFKTKWSCCWIS